MLAGVNYLGCRVASRRNVTRQVDHGYLTDQITQRAVDWIGRVAAGPAPFMLSLYYTGPHWPWETREDVGKSA